MIKLIFRQFKISISHITGECAIWWVYGIVDKLYIIIDVLSLQ